MLRRLLLIPFIGLVTGQLTNGCYPVPPNSTGGPLTVIKTSETPKGFHSDARGWNSWGVQASPRTTPSYGSTLSSAINQSFVIEQCSILAKHDILAAGYNLCSIDDYWYSSVTDDYGRVVWNSTSFDIPELASYLHGIGLKLGIYYTPGIPCDATNKIIYGTNITIGSTFNGVVDTNDSCYFDYDNPDTQLYHDSLLKLWASWGVDMIKLDFITPGSIVGSLGMPSNVSFMTLAYHQAIANSGRQIRLDLSSNICRDKPYLGTWEASAESMRVAIDINSYGDSTFVGMWLIQNIIE